MAQFSHKGISIEVNDSGQFQAEIEGVRLAKDRLWELREQIDKELKVKVEVIKAEPLKLPVTVVAHNNERHWASKRIATNGIITGINRTTGHVMITAPDITNKWTHEWILVDTPENREIAEALAEAINCQSQARLRIERKAINPSRAHGNIPYEKYAELSKALEQEHSRRSQDAATEAANGSPNENGVKS